MEQLSFALGELLEGDAGTFSDDGSWIPDPEVSDRIRPTIAQETGADRFLTDKGMALTPEAYALFIDNVSGEFFNATRLLKRRAAGDYSIDERLGQFPKFNDAPAPKPYKRTGLTPWTLFDAYVNAKQPASSTVNRWRGVFLHLEDHFEHRSVSSITDDEAQAWADGLLNKERALTR